MRHRLVTAFSSMTEFEHGFWLGALAEAVLWTLNWPAWLLIFFLIAVLAARRTLR